MRGYGALVVSYDGAGNDGCFAAPAASHSWE